LLHLLTTACGTSLPSAHCPLSRRVLEGKRIICQVPPATSCAASHASSTSIGMAPSALGGPSLAAFEHLLGDECGSHRRWPAGVERQMGNDFAQFALFEPVVERTLQVADQLLLAAERYQGGACDQAAVALGPGRSHTSPNSTRSLRSTRAGTMSRTWSRDDEGCCGAMAYPFLLGWPSCGYPSFVDYIPSAGRSDAVAVGGVADHLPLPSERGTWPSKLAAMIMRRVGRVNSCHRPLLCSCPNNQRACPWMSSRVRMGERPGGEASRSSQSGELLELRGEGGDLVLPRGAGQEGERPPEKDGCQSPGGYHTFTGRSGSPSPEPEQ